MVKKSLFKRSFLSSNPYLFQVLLLIEEILLTSWYGKYPIMHKVLYIPGGVGFLPSTVCEFFWGCNDSNQKNSYDLQFMPLIEHRLWRPFQCYKLARLFSYCILSTKISTDGSKLSWVVGSEDSQQKKPSENLRGHNDRNRSLAFKPLKLICMNESWYIMMHPLVFQRKHQLGCASHGAARMTMFPTKWRANKQFLCGGGSHQPVKIHQQLLYFILPIFSSSFQDVHVLLWLAAKKLVKFDPMSSFLAGKNKQVL